MMQTMWKWMIELYGEDELKKLPMIDLLEAAWFLYTNPINEKRIKQIFDRNGAKFTEIPI